MDTTDTTLSSVIELIGGALGIEDRSSDFTAESPLFGEVPELDSLGLVQLALALEERFGFTIEDDEFTGDVFENVGSLRDFVDGKLRQVATE